jgi:NMD protein affecting ribosome stability and mRNA decay
MKTRAIPSGFHPIRHDRLVQERVHDAYKTKGKLPEPTVCPDCGAVFHEGRWQWLAAPPGAHRHACPACLRQHDHYPAGYVTLDGEFFASHRAEVMNLVQNEAEHERAEHPLKRIMEIEEKDGMAEVTTTDIHLARQIGEALHHAYQGKLEFHYNPEQNLLRVGWIH